VDFSYTEEQAELAGLARHILTRQVTPERQAGLEEAGAALDEPLWKDLAGAGVLAAALPGPVNGAGPGSAAEPGGGPGPGLLGQCAVLAEIGRTVAPVPYLASIVLGAEAVARFGAAEQWRRWGLPAAHGEVILTAALAEDRAGDPGVPAVTATPGAESPDAWLLSGVKTAVPAAVAADLVLVPASTPGGVAVFLASPSDPGVRIEPQQVTGGGGEGRVILDDARLPPGRLLGQPGPRIAGWLAGRATVGLCALQLGVAERALELTAEYARTRVQFGRPIGSFQAVAQRLADAYIDLEAIRLTMWQAAWLLARADEAGDGAAGPGGPGEDGAADEAAAAVATAKFWAADAGHRIAHTAVHVHGGVGIDVSYPLHRYFTAASHLEFSLGGATPQLRKLGALLAAQPPG
jgi:3-oxocholest-4-en-26-oyl-CoA dehydrogenase beta subunit